MIKNNSENTESHNIFFILLLIIAMLIWGGSWTSAKLITGMVNPLVFAFLRFIISFVSFIPMVLFYKERIIIDIKTFILILFSSSLVVAYNILFFLGLKYGLAGAGGVLVTSINPIFTFIFSLIIFKKKIYIKEYFGLFFGLIGGLILLEIWKTNLNDLIGSGNLIFILASITWSLLAIASERILKKTTLFVFSFYLYGISSVMNFFIALPFGIDKIFKMNLFFWMNIIYLTVISTVFATSIYFLGSRKMTANKTSSFILLVPIFAVMISFFVLKEIPKITTIIGGIFAIIAIYLINRKTVTLIE